MSLILRATYYLLEAISYLLLARVILSWIPQLRQSKFYGFIHQVTEPLLIPVRKLLSRTSAANWPFDISIIIVFLLLRFIRILLIPYI